MSLSYLRDAVLKRLQDRVDTVVQSAIDMRVQSMKMDEYAMLQVDKLAEARALATAALIVGEEYKRLTEPAPKPEDQPQPKTLAESVY